MPALSINTSDLGPLTIPLTQVRRLSRALPGNFAVVELVDGEKIQTTEQYKTVSERMTSVNVGGLIQVENLC